MEIQAILPILQTLLAIANIIIIGYGFFKFTQKPHDNLESRITTLELEHREFKHSLLQGNDRFREQDEANEILLHSIMALIEFEVQYCLLEHKEMSKDLEKVREDLHHYLSKR